MAAVTKNGTPSLASLTPAHENTLAAIAGEDISAGDALYVFGVSTQYDQPIVKKAKAANGVSWWALRDAKSGFACDCVRNVRMKYGSSLTPGNVLYASGTTAGGLDTAAANAANEPVAEVVTDTVIQCLRAKPGANS